MKLKASDIFENVENLSILKHIKIEEGGKAFLFLKWFKPIQEQLDIIEELKDKFLDDNTEDKTLDTKKQPALYSKFIAFMFDALKEQEIEVEPFPLLKEEELNSLKNVSMDFLMFADKLGLMYKD